MTALSERPISTSSSPEPRDSGSVGLPTADLTALVRHVASDVDRWLPRLQLPDGSDRWWTRLAADGQVDVWLLSWLPGHSTDLHDHGASAAAFTVVRGRLSEVRIDAAGERTSHVRETGSATSLGAGVLHDVTGAGTEPAVSIHAYSPPLTTMNYFDPVTLRVVRTVQSNEPEEELAR